VNTTQLISRLEFLPPEEKTPELAELEKELRDHAKYFNDLITQIATTGVLTDEIRKEREERGKMMRRLAEKVLAKLAALETLAHLKETYETQVSRYRALGWLVKKKEKEGIVGVDKKFYPIPSFDTVKDVISEQGELFTYKHSQGFKNIMLVPIGMSYVEMYTKLQSEYERYSKDVDGTLGGLYHSDISGVTKITKISKEFFCHDSMAKEKKLEYYPVTLESKDKAVHRAKSKTELLAHGHFPGWELHVLPENLLLVEGKNNLVIGDRPVFEPKTRCEEYLEILAGKKERKDGISVKDAEGKSVYRGEVGLIPEVWVALALEQLYTTNLVYQKAIKKPNGLSNGTMSTGTLLMGTLINDTDVSTSYFSIDYDMNILVLKSHATKRSTLNDFLDPDVCTTSVKIC